MKKARILMFSLFFLQVSTEINTARYQPPQKHVIGCACAGLFSIFFGVLNHLGWCERNNKVPVVYWGTDCIYFQPEGYNGSYNAWEYYFEPLSNLPYVPGEFVNGCYYAPDSTCIEFRVMGGISLYNHIESAGRLVRKYIRVKPNIVAKARAFYNQHIAGKKTIGIHLRGTDKHKEYLQVDPTILLHAASQYTNCQYLVATDEEKLLDLAKRLLKGNVISYPAVRSKTGVPVHLDTDKNKAARGEEVLIEVLLLSNCHKFIHAASNVSAAVYFFNPQLQGTLFTMYGQPMDIGPGKRKKYKY